MASQDSTEKTLEKIMGERREKADALRKGGRHPYRNDLAPSHTCGQVRERYGETLPAEARPGIHPIDGEIVSLAGRVVARRGFGKTVFVPLRDSTGELQLFLNVESADPRDFAEVLPQLDVGDIVWAEGEVFWTKRGELSLLTKRFAIVTKSLRPLPDKWHGLTDVETRYRQRYLDLTANPEVREVFRLRSQLVRGVRQFLDRARLPRSRDADDAPDHRRCGRPAFHHPPQRARHAALHAHRPRALFKEAPRRRL